MAAFTLMVSSNLGISYYPRYSTDDRQDPELLKKIEEASEQGSRFYIEGDDGFLCPIHEKILETTHGFRVTPLKQTPLEKKVRALQEKFHSR